MGMGNGALSQTASAWMESVLACGAGNLQARGPGAYAGEHMQASICRPAKYIRVSKLELASCGNLVPGERLDSHLVFAAPAKEWLIEAEETGLLRRVLLGEWGLRKPCLPTTYVCVLPIVRLSL